MNHKKRITSSNKSVYILILSSGLLIAAAVLFTMLIGNRINFLYTTILNASFEVKTDLSLARINVLNYINKPSEQILKDTWQFISLAEFNTKIILEEKDKHNIISNPLNDGLVTEEVHLLQVQLLEFQNLANNVFNNNISKPDHSSVQVWNELFDRLEAQSLVIENKLKAKIAEQTKIFRFAQFGLMGAGIFSTLIAALIFFRYEKQKILFQKKFAETSITLEKRSRRATKTEEAYLESQRQLNTLVQNLPGMVYRCRITRPWAFDYVSEKCTQVIGYRPDDLTDNSKISFYELIHPDDRRKNLELVKIAIEERRPFQLIYRVKTAAGYEKWVWEQGVAVYSESDDEPVALEGFITDITEQKTVEDAVSLQSQALEAAANGMVITDSDGIVLWANSSFTRLTGFSLKESIGKKLNFLRSGVQDESFYSFMWTKIKSGEMWRGEIVNKRKDGSFYTEEMTITPTLNTAGEIISFVAVKQDITERKSAEFQLIESELRFRGLFENATVGMYQTTPGGKVIMANPTLIRILGYDSLEELSSRNVLDQYSDPAIREIFMKEIAKYGEILGFEAQWKKKDGTLIYIRESSRVVKDKDNKILYYEGQIEDVTEKKKTEQELITAKEKAEQSDRLKSEFLAQISHEIRTPLNVILSFTSIMKEELKDKVDEEMRGAFDVIDSEGKRIMRTVELILNMSELQTGSYNYKSKKIDLAKDVLEKMNRSFQQVAKQKKVSFSIVNNTQNTTLEVDEYSVNQIFSHLIDNALKYTLKGRVNVIIDQDPRGNLYVDVSDTGIGIAEEYLPRLFTPFTREEKGYTRSFEGNGLGLALVKKYCQLNNAEIKVTSIKGSGTTFRIIFPR